MKDGRTRLAQKAEHADYASALLSLSAMCSGMIIESEAFDVAIGVVAPRRSEAAPAAQAGQALPPSGPALF